MYSVTQRIKTVSQPPGGYVKPEDFTLTIHPSRAALSPEENVRPCITGTAVDYLTRLAIGSPAERAFAVSLDGAEIAGEEEYAASLLDGITGLDDLSVTNACRLVSFDDFSRGGRGRAARAISPDAATARNVREMVMRCVRFWEENGPVISDGFTFPGGYSALVSAGDGDYLTADTIWDLKVSRSPLTPDQTLQLLMYWIMGKRSVCPELRSVKRLGVFNPRLNVSYVLDTATIPDDVVREVCRDVFGYPEEDPIPYGTADGFYGRLLRGLNRTARGSLFKRGG